MLKTWDLGPDGHMVVFEPEEYEEDGKKRQETPQLVSLLLEAKTVLDECADVVQISGKDILDFSAHFTDKGFVEEVPYWEMVGLERLDKNSSEEDLALEMTPEEWKKTRKRFPAGVVTIKDNEMTKVVFGYTDEKAKPVAIQLNIQKSLWNSVIKMLRDCDVISKACYVRLKIAS